MIRRFLRRLVLLILGPPPEVEIEAVIEPAVVDTSPAMPPPPTDFDALVRLVDEHGHPNINGLWRVTKDIEALRLNVKALGYEQARILEAGLQSIPVEHARVIGLNSKPITQADIEARWCRSWCATLRERPRYHRRLWESAFVLQALFEADALIPDAKVLAVGEVDGSVISHLARNEVRSTVLATEPPGYRDDLIDAFTFQNNVNFQPLEAGALEALSGFDACWSIGSMGRMGSIRAGMDFVLASMATLKPGGVAVHVFDFNFADDEQTIDDWGAVLFQRRHIEALADELTVAGYAPRPLDFRVGHQFLDRFIDVPPFDNGRTESFAGLWRDGWQGAHLRMSVDGFAVTSFGLICRRSMD